MKWKQMWQQLKPTGATWQELTPELIAALVKRLEWQQVQATSRSDWRLYQDLSDAAQSLQTLIREKERLTELLNRLNSAQVQKPEREC